MKTVFDDFCVLMVIDWNMGLVVGSFWLLAVSLCCCLPLSVCLSFPRIIIEQGFQAWSPYFLYNTRWVWVQKVQSHTTRQWVSVDYSLWVATSSFNNITEWLSVQHKQGGVISSADWKLDPLELANKFNSKTKMIIINNPNNPLGKVSRWLRTTTT